MHRTILSAGFVSDSRLLSDLLGAATRGIEPSTVLPLSKHLEMPYREVSGRVLDGIFLNAYIVSVIL
jgi:hypothetical protein